MNLVHALGVVHGLAFLESIRVNNPGFAVFFVCLAFHKAINQQLDRRHGLRVFRSSHHQQHHVSNQHRTGNRHSCTTPDCLARWRSALLVQAGYGVFVGLWGENGRAGSAVFSPAVPPRDRRWQICPTTTAGRSVAHCCCYSDLSTRIFRWNGWVLMEEIDKCTTSMRARALAMRSSPVLGRLSVSSSPSSPAPVFLSLARSPPRAFAVV
ncbi:hypothetical protein BV898_11953 [Hypsibius exemplaris]|uniref:Uncharacterized protein n=1 Tax=Hypsibius exemplaris TaxID=2072580 RepID=A0A1W0WF66_HYPEX|nr:hypothetical protein BV898_11953 [Hypsibius exemplaris]